MICIIKNALKMKIQGILSNASIIILTSKIKFIL